MVSRGPTSENSDKLHLHGAQHVWQARSTADASFAETTANVRGEEELDMSFLAEMEQELADDDLYVPRTPLPDLPLQPPSPRASPTSRAHNETGEEEHDAKKAMTFGVMRKICNFPMFLKSFGRTPQ